VEEAFARATVVADGATVVGVMAAIAVVVVGGNVVVVVAAIVVVVVVGGSVVVVVLVVEVVVVVDDAGGITPLISILRISKLKDSPTYNVEPRTATLFGCEKVATLFGPSTRPWRNGKPPMVVTTPPGVTRRIVELLDAATYRLFAPSMASPMGKLNCPVAANVVTLPAGSIFECSCLELR
jgi:hypothetical protein